MFVGVGLSGAKVESPMANEPALEDGGELAMPLIMILVVFEGLVCEG